MMNSADDTQGMDGTTPRYRDRGSGPTRKRDDLFLKVKHQTEKLKGIIFRNRNCIAFWIFGLTNNYPYVIMLSAADHILEGQRHVGTAVILLADIIPTLFCKTFGPWFIVHYFSYKTRVFVVSLSAILSFILVGLSPNLYVSITGVACASFSAGLGEVTFLALSHHFDSSVIGFWSSGTGAAGAIGATSYLLLSFILRPRMVLFVMIFFPLLMIGSFVYLLSSEESPRQEIGTDDAIPLFNGNEDEVEMDDILNELENHGNSHDSSDASVSRTKFDLSKDQSNNLPFKTKVSLIKPLLKYMVPLMVVYFAEYTINQGVIEHVWWKHPSLSNADQYTIYQALYQLGVFASRSSRSCFPVKRVWILALVQVINLLVLLVDAYFQVIPFLPLYCLVIFYEGLIGGSAYVNSFANIAAEVKYEHREFSLGFASLADTTGIIFAGFASLGVNAWLYPLESPR